MKNIHLVAHTHWDREWYKPYRYFRTKLVYMMDRLLSMLEAEPDFGSFMLDGQSIVLDDYLNIRPEDSGRIAELAGRGRLKTGPWYIQPDEFAPDAESLVRNLLIGTRIARKFGSPMMVGYLPDSFGHSSQMPQILRGFGIDSAVVMRGVDFDRIESTEFRWTGLNGDEVTGIYLLKGYMNAMFLSENNSINSIRIKKLAGELGKLTKAESVLVMNGVDHAFAQKQAAALCGGQRGWSLGSLEDYVGLVRKTDCPLPNLSGELITPRHHRVHTSIASTRMNQKITNRKLSVMLERLCEPVCTAAMLGGAEYPNGLIEDAWKVLLSNQTHDGICGCCTDEVHREMDQRFTDVRQICESLIKPHGRALAQKAVPDGPGLIVFNTAMRTETRHVEAEVLINGKFSLTDDEGRPVEYQVLSSEETDLSKLSIWTLYLGTPEPAERVRILFRCGFDSVFGYRAFRIVPAGGVEGAGSDVLANSVAAGAGQPASFGNEYYDLVINGDGSLDITDKASGRSFFGLCVFEDCGEGGDTYNHSPLPGDEAVLSSGFPAGIERTEDGPLRTVFRIETVMTVPAELSADGLSRSDRTAELPLETEIILYRHSRRIDFRVRISNRILSHRLRVLFPFTEAVGSSFAETQFGVIRRETAAPGYGEDWPEIPLPIFSMQRFCGLGDEAAAIAVLNRGLTEYEVYRRETFVLAVTLHRGVSMLGKAGLAIRPGRASGIEVPVPDAESQGELIREFSLLAGGNLSFENITAEADCYAAPDLAIQNRLDLGSIVRENGDFFKYLSIDNLQSVIESSLDSVGAGSSDLIKLSGGLSVSAIKKAEDGRSVIMRLFNPASEPVRGAVLRVLFEHSGAKIVRLDESPVRELSGEDGYRLPETGPNCQITVRIIRGENDR